MSTAVTLREYFAARAPHTPAPWFKPAMRTCPPHRWVAEDGREFATWQAAENEVGDLFTDANHEARERWALAYQVTTMAQWPWAWADVVLKAQALEL